MNSSSPSSYDLGMDSTTSTLEEEEDYTHLKWIHCNSCFRTIDTGFGLGSSINNFYFTSCSHIFCSNCFDQADGKCIACGQFGCESFSLARDKQNALREYLVNPVLQLQRFVDILRVKKSNHMFLIKNTEIVLKFNI